MSKGTKARQDVIRRAAAHLDQVTLDRVWAAALRGDMDLVEKTLAPYVSSPAPTTTRWRDSSSWLFGRSAFNRNSR